MYERQIVFTVTGCPAVTDCLDGDAARLQHRPRRGDGPVHERAAGYGAQPTRGVPRVRASGPPVATGAELLRLLRSEADRVSAIADQLREAVETVGDPVTAEAEMEAVRAAAEQRATVAEARAAAAEQRAAEPTSGGPKPTQQQQRWQHG